MICDEAWCPCTPLGSDPKLRATFCIDTNLKCTHANSFGTTSKVGLGSCLGQEPFCGGVGWDRFGVVLGNAQSQGSDRRGAWARVSVKGDDSLSACHPAFCLLTQPPACLPTTVVQAHRICMPEADSRQSSREPPRNWLPGRPIYHKFGIGCKKTWPQEPPIRSVSS